ncbi:hypothetical protein TNIN_304431 [Trichonephila inaurata madagascariensis]|uniref:Uncharacterized protein n=1 Tax=Trichonephila inaurata madagascariensis TaxID=2747483 RepID=A0A8X7BN45_9ARAC|nr:hypothetical protein TNIN_304431 [Trichonephila inaurata madagascariensis]
MANFEREMVEARTHGASIRESAVFVKYSRAVVVKVYRLEYQLHLENTSKKWRRPPKSFCIIFPPPFHILISLPVPHNGRAARCMTEKTCTRQHLVMHMSRQVPAIED